MLNPESQYADDRNLLARQRLWGQQRPRFDLYGWVLGLAGLDEGRPGGGTRVVDVGCGNGAYLTRLQDRGIDALGCDLSPGMLRGARARGVTTPLVNGDVTALPLRGGAADVTLAPHMLYHVPDRTAAAHELRRITRPGGVCIVTTNGPAHMRTLRRLVEAAAREATPGWEMQNPSTVAFSTANGAAQLGVAFDTIDLVPVPGPDAVRLDDAGIAADYVASVADHYQHTVDRPWHEIVDRVRAEVARTITTDGTFTVAADTGAFVCR